MSVVAAIAIIAGLLLAGWAIECALDRRALNRDPRRPDAGNPLRGRTDDDR